MHQLTAPQSDMVARGSECQVVKIEKQVKGSCLQFAPGGIQGGSKKAKFLVMHASGIDDYCRSLTLAAKCDFLFIYLFLLRGGGMANIL